MQSFEPGLIERSCPGVSRPTINRVLAELRSAGKISCIRAGRDAIWEKKQS
jgi:CRP-like cAMP-binding protein